MISLTILLSADPNITDQSTPTRGGYVAQCTETL